MNCIRTFWTVVRSKNVFDSINGFKTLFQHSLPINILQTSIISHTNMSHSLFLFLLQSCVPSLAFHRKKSLWKFSVIVWTVNGDGTMLERAVVCLGVMLVNLGLRLVCLGARLTIMVCYSLEAPVHPPSLVSSSPPSSFLLPYFLSTSGWSHWYSLRD